MKQIRYFIDNLTNTGTEEIPSYQHNLFQKSIPYSDINEEIAKREAYNNEYEIIEVEDPVTKPTQAERFEAQLTYTAMMTNTLLPEEE